MHLLMMFPFSIKTLSSPSFRVFFLYTHTNFARKFYYLFTPCLVYYFEKFQKAELLIIFISSQAREIKETEDT